jgi:putative tryptophan/tyrosine transport system substrate-binding protein
VIRDTIAKLNMVALGRVVLARREHVIALEPKDRGLVGMTLRYPYEVRGGLMSYGPSLPNQFRRAADYVDKILRGAKPGDLPVEQPTKFDFIINLTTAKTLGLQIPDRLLALADEVIE